MNTEEKRKRIEMLVKLGALGVVGFFVAPFVFISIKGILGLAVAAAIGVAAINFAPYFAMKIANWRLKAIKAEAMKNPVETLQNQYRREQEKLATALQKIKTFFAAIEDYKGKLTGFIKRFPDEADKYKEVLTKMQALYNLRQKKYQQAEKELGEFKLVIHKADAIWQMAQAANELGEAAGMSEDDFFAELQKETAFDSVQKNLNMALAELETSLLDEADGAAIPALTNSKPTNINDRVTKEPIGQ